MPDHNDLIFSGQEDERQKALSQMHKSKQRPLCPCSEPRIPMYIAKIGEQYFVKRMPNTGALHSPECDSYEPPPELGEVLGTAIRENEEDGITELKLGFSMAKIAGRAAPTASDDDSDSIKTDGSKLTLRSVLHYLWEQAGFNKWTPAMTGKRTWAVVQKHLLAAAEDKMAKGMRLAEKLYLPEPFYVERKDAIKHKRMAQMAKISAKESGPRKLMILIGEMKEIVPARYGHKIIVKHAADFPFMLADDIHKLLLKRYEEELELLEKCDDKTMHMVVIATFSVSTFGIASIEEIALMPTTGNWIPFEHIWDKDLIETLTTDNRRFTKGLRYNLTNAKPLASVVLSDTKPLPTAMYIIPAESEDSFLDEVDALKEESTLESWVWNTSSFEMPDIPMAASK